MRTEDILLTLDAAREARGEMIRAWWLRFLHGAAAPKTRRAPTRRAADAAV